MDGESLKLFGMSPTQKVPVFLYEQIIEPTLGHGKPLALLSTILCLQMALTTCKYQARAIASWASVISLYTVPKRHVGLQQLNPICFPGAEVLCPSHLECFWVYPRCVSAYCLAHLRFCHITSTVKQMSSCSLAPTTCHCP